jgi:hypothetical protein
MFIYFTFWSLVINLDVFWKHVFSYKRHFRWRKMKCSEVQPSISEDQVKMGHQLLKPNSLACAPLKSKHIQIPVAWITNAALFCHCITWCCSWTNSRILWWALQIKAMETKFVEVNWTICQGWQSGWSHLSKRSGFNVIKIFFFVINGPMI